jgi:hypothetical protein
MSGAGTGTKVGSGIVGVTSAMCGTTVGSTVLTDGALDVDTVTFVGGPNQNFKATIHTAIRVAVTVNDCSASSITRTMRSGESFILGDFVLALGARFRYRSTGKNRI